MKPVIAIDAQTTVAQKTGLGFYTANLIHALPKVAPEFAFRFVTPSRSGDLNMPRRLLWDQIGFPARTAGAHLVHQPAFSTPILTRAKVVVTVHDLISLRYRDLPFWPSQFFGRFMPFSHRFADHLIADSDNTKRDIVRFLRLPAEKITVVYLAADPMYRPVKDRAALARVTKNHHIPGPYLVHVGTLNPRKNLEFLVCVFGRLASRYPKLTLVIAGNKGWYAERITAEINRLGLAGRVILTGYLAEGDLPILLAGAEVATFPSLYEGFGLPPLEAMAAGVPVVSSNASSLPEVVGEAGRLASPTDEAAWVNAIARLLDSSPLRAKMIEAGISRAKEFSWDKTARQTADVYARVLQGGQR